MGIAPTLAVLFISVLALSFGLILACSLDGKAPAAGKESDDDLNFCTKCAAPLVMRLLGGHWRKACASDEPGHYVHWNNPKPVSIVRIPRPGNKLLMIRRQIDPGKGKWALPGGFNEGYKPPGNFAGAAVEETFAETVEQAGAREVFEEALVRVKIARWVTDFTPKNESNTQVHLLDAEPNSDPAQAGDEVLEVRDFAEGELSPDEVAFPSHYQAYCEFFANRR